VFVYLPGESVLKVGFGMEYRALLSQRRENLGYRDVHANILRDSLFLDLLHSLFQ
jgi:hypothetical protein